MLMLKKILLFLVGLAAAAAMGQAAYIWWSLQPKIEPLALPDGLIALSEPRGNSLLQDAAANVDYAALAENYESQELRSFCGVASGVAVLNSLGEHIDQGSFFDTGSAETKSRIDVMMQGMTLAELAQVLAAHGSVVTMKHGDEVEVDEFRQIVARNLSEPGNYILVNYQREVLGQRRVGHISPLAAYDKDSDLVLIMDTASYNYPPTWVPLTKLYSAMAAIDPSSGKARGFVEVSGPLQQ